MDFVQYQRPLISSVLLLFLGFITQKVYEIVSKYWQEASP